MRAVQFSETALKELQLYKFGNAKLVFKIFELITDIQKTPFEGLGKPEPLKSNFSGYWSRRINDEHRLIYAVKESVIEIVKCYGHYHK
ncbi:MAG: Txe/YoeB family addiction module toxin [Mucilaginibacter sp.]|uniref:Txe/YoeB family addiction module toxin n=1 Tax=Mucilaginibacter sp. TaxID=1882438 RepID=UPI0034E5D8DD